MSDKITFSDGDNRIKKKVCEFSPEEIERIRKNDPNAQIMKVVYDEVEEIMSMIKVKNALTIIRGMFENLRKEFPEKSDDDIRTIIRQKSTVAEKMASHTHPKMFLLMTNRESTEDDFNMLMFNIHLREQVEKGQITDEEAVAMLYSHMIKIAQQEEDNKLKK